MLSMKAISLKKFARFSKKEKTDAKNLTFCSNCLTRAKSSHGACDEVGRVESQETIWHEL